MLVGLIWLLACQLVGEVVVRLTDAPIPGAVVGMVLLFVVLRWRRTPDSAPVIRAGDYLLGHLQLFFVPAGVGVLAYLGALRAHALPVLVGMLGSWLLAIATVGWAVTALIRRRGGETGPAPEEIE
ncbi:CidA/LrgA family protein [Nocardioides sp.]|uniref:CidA/LrgA family protein n=1 Tax=Nocardioides sp. TaxID=35761 RepID=UPI002CD3D299|nr:CidA/LrgA family protein [Nocardioides sp.]HVX54891.1 CidA/LrgA family protein [Nocardioides sp.]